MVDRKSAKTMAGTRGKRSRKTKTGRRRRGRGGGTRGRVLSVRRLVLAMRNAGDLLKMESSIEESAFIVSGGANIVGEEGERERRRWREKVRVFGGRREESIGLEAAPHRILMRERENGRGACFRRRVITAMTMLRRKMSAREDQDVNTINPWEYEFLLIEVWFTPGFVSSGKKRKRTASRGPPEMAAAAVVDTEAEAEDMFSNRVITATEGIRRRSSVDFCEIRREEDTSSRTMPPRPTRLRARQISWKPCIPALMRTSAVGLSAKRKMRIARAARKNRCF